MKEVGLRRWHRGLGIIVALFIILQTGSGFLLSLGELSVPHTHAHEGAYAPGHDHKEGESSWHKALEFIHYGGSTAGTIYRLVIGISLLAMAVSGSTIFFKMRARFRKS